MPTNFNKILNETPQEVKDFVSRNMDILERIHELLDEKFEGKQNLLAKKLGKSEAEVSKMLNGVKNFTLKTIIKLEKAFGERIIHVETNSPNFEVASVKCAPRQVTASGNYKITAGGELTEHYSEVHFKKPEFEKKNIDLA